MPPLVAFQREDSISTITMDDGKVNALSLPMITELNAALDQAASAGGVVLLGGRDGVFSAGFDLPVLRAGGTEAATMLRAGFELAERLLSFPRPVVVACTGHAVAMGAFLLLSGDYRVGAAGQYKLTANEVAIGLTLPRAAVEILRQRLTPAYLVRAATLAEPFSPANAVEAGFLDQVVDAGQLPDIARGVAGAMAGLEMAAHAATKLRVRQHTLDALRAAIDADHAEFRQRSRG